MIALHEGGMKLANDAARDVVGHCRPVPDITLRRDRAARNLRAARVCKGLA
jgi:hypothetical protein